MRTEKPKQEAKDKLNHETKKAAPKKGKDQEPDKKTIEPKPNGKQSVGKKTPTKPVEKS